MIIDCISDLHGFYPDLNGGDLLIIAGDITATDTTPEYIEFACWLGKQDYKKIILIAGNHDNLMNDWQSGFYLNTYYKLEYLLDSGTEFESLKLEYLLDSGTEFEGLKIWGSPWTKRFYGQNPQCSAFTFPTEKELKEKFDLIPNDINILVTHSPPYGILDNNYKEHVGSKSLKNIVLSHDRMPKLKLHVFGHIHECGGSILNTQSCKFVNSSIVNEHYEPVNKIVRVIL